MAGMWYNHCIDLSTIKDLQQDSDLGIDRNNPTETARAIAALDVWEKAAARNWALVSQLSDEPFLASVNPGREGPIRGRLLLFQGFGPFREYMLSRQIPDFGVATTPMDFRHFEAVGLTGGKAELFSYVPVACRCPQMQRRNPSWDHSSTPAMD